MTASPVDPLPLRGASRTPRNSPKREGGLRPVGDPGDPQPLRGAAAALPARRRGRGPPSRVSPERRHGHGAGHHLAVSSRATSGPQKLPPRVKPRVPSTGSTIQRVAASPAWAPVSSPRMAWPGKAAADHRHDGRLGVAVGHGHRRPVRLHLDADAAAEVAQAAAPPASTARRAVAMARSRSRRHGGESTIARRAPERERPPRGPGAAVVRALARRRGYFLGRMSPVCR